MVNEYPELHLDNQLCFSLYSLSRKVIQNYTPLLKPLDLTYPQYLVMLVLWQSMEEGEEGLAVSQLTNKLKLDTGTITPLLKRMEVKGLLTRQRSAKDERMVVIRLTAAGSHLRESAKHIPQALLCQAGQEVKGLIELRETLKLVLNAL